MSFLAADKCMPKMHLKQTRFTSSACRAFTKIKERIQKFNKTRDSRYIYRNELNKLYFQHYMFYVDFKGLPRKTVFDKNYVIKFSILLKIQNMMNNK